MTDTPAAPPPADAPAPEPKGAYWWGMLRTFGLDFAVPTAVSMAMGLLTMPIHFLMPGSRILMTAEAAVGGIVGIVGMGIGVSQWLWILPLARRYKAQGRVELAKGMMSGAWMVFLLNAGCWGLFGAFAFMAH